MAKSKSNGLGILLVIIIAGLLVFGALSFFGAKDISEVKAGKYVGEEVKVKGVVQETMEIGDYSLYSLEDDTDSIGVASNDPSSFPEKGETVTVEGILKDNPLLGYYIEVEK